MCNSVETCVVMFTANIYFSTVQRPNNWKKGYHVYKGVMCSVMCNEMMKYCIN